MGVDGVCTLFCSPISNAGLVFILWIQGSHTDVWQGGFVPAAFIWFLRLVEFQRALGFCAPSSFSLRSLLLGILSEPWRRAPSSEDSALARPWESLRQAGFSYLLCGLLFLHGCSLFPFFPCLFLFLLIVNTFQVYRKV